MGVKDLALGSGLMEDSLKGSSVNGESFCPGSENPAVFESVLVFGVVVKLS